MKKLSILGALSAGLLLLASSFTQAAAVEMAPTLYDSSGSEEWSDSTGIDTGCVSVDCLTDAGQLQIPPVTFPSIPSKPQTYWICACWFIYAMPPVNETTVPAPAAIWLFGSGLLGLGAVARKRRQ